jgi:hypothetical protein
MGTILDKTDAFGALVGPLASQRETGGRGLGEAAGPSGRGQRRSLAIRFRAAESARNLVKPQSRLAHKMHVASVTVVVHPVTHAERDPGRVADSVRIAQA